MGNSCLNVDAKTKKTKVTHRRPTMERQNSIQKALKEDFEKLEKETKKGCKEFLAFVNDTYAPEGKKINLTEESLKEN